jgi:alpha-amylase/alpha-mannosidase (GH57 family)
VAQRISLALALHNHQPVGNFGWVFGDVYDTAYRPMLDALDRHPRVRLALHYTGPLLDWLRAEAVARGTIGPDDLDLIRSTDDMAEACSMLTAAYAARATEDAKAARVEDGGSARGRTATPGL